MQDLQDLGPSRSNITSNIETCERFFKEALRVTYSLRYRFYSVFEQMSAEDVVMECFVKILKGNISYDESKKCKFETFVRMIVTCQLTDELKRLSASKRSAVVVSLDSEAFVDSSEEDVSTMYNSIGDSKSDYWFNYSEIQEDLHEIEKELYANESITASILDMCEEGYLMDDVASECNIDRLSIRPLLNNIKNIYLNRSEGLSVQISDILYGDEDILEKSKDYVLSVTSFIFDDITGVRLSDVIKLVLGGYSYRGIGEKLKIDESDVRRFLTRYETLRV